MAKFVFKNVSADRNVKLGYDAPVNPILGFDADYAPVAKAAEDMTIKAGDIKIPVYDLGVHSVAVVHAGEAFTVETDKAAEIAFYTDLACKLAKSDSFEVTVEGAEPTHDVYSI